MYLPPVSVLHKLGLEVRIVNAEVDIEPLEFFAAILRWMKPSRQDVKISQARALDTIARLGLY